MNKHLDSNLWKATLQLSENCRSDVRWTYVTDLRVLCSFGHEHLRIANSDSLAHCMGFPSGSFCPVTCLENFALAQAEPLGTEGRTWQHLLPQVVDGRGKLTLSFLSMELFQTYTNRRMDGTYISCFLSLTSRRILGCLMFWARRRFSFAVMDSGKFEVRKTHLSLDYAFGWFSIGDYNGTGWLRNTTFWQYTGNTTIKKKEPEPVL